MRDIVLGTGLLVVFASETVLAGAHSSPRSTAVSQVSSFHMVSQSGFLVDTHPAYAFAPFNQSSPSAASDGHGSLVVWSDTRSGSADIYGCRVGAGGTPADEAGLAISTAPGAERYPDAAFDGTNYLVVWSDHRTDTSDIYASRVTPGGVVLDPEGVPVAIGPGFQGYPSVACDGAVYLVVWSDGSGPGSICASRVALDGQVLDSAITLPACPAIQAAPAVAFDGVNYLVVWTDVRDDISGDIYAARVAPSGEVLDTLGFPVGAAPNFQAGAAMAWDGSVMLVVWHDLRETAFADLYGARVDTDGTVLDPDGILVAAAPDYQWAPSLASNGDNFLVVWQDGRGHGDVFGTRVTRDGEVLDPDGLLIRSGPESQMSPAVAWDGSNCLVVWQDTRTGVSDISVFGARVANDGTLVDPDGFLISTAAAVQQLPAAASDGMAVYAIVWEERRGMEWDIRAVRLRRDGGLLDPIPLTVSLAGGSQRAPALVYDGRSYLAVWEDGEGRTRDIRGARVTPDGQVLDSSGIPICTAEWEQLVPAVASGSRNSLVVWQDWRLNGFHIFGARVSRDGRVLDSAGIRMSAGGGWERAPAVAADSTGYLVVWVDVLSGRDIHGARVSADGLVLDTAAIVIGGSEGSAGEPAIGFDGTNYLVVWPERRSDGVGIHGARVTSDGTVLDTVGIQVCAGAGTRDAPTVMVDRGSWLVVWQEHLAGQVDLRGARLTPEGELLTGFPVATGAGDQSQPALASAGDAGTLVTYSGWTGVVGGRSYNSSRIWAITSATTDADEMSDARLAPPGLQTVVRGALRLPTSTAPGGHGRFALVNTAGRMVLELRAGKNDVGGLPAGVYFVRSGVDGLSSKVLITR